MKARICLCYGLIGEAFLIMKHIHKELPLNTMMRQRRNLFKLFKQKFKIPWVEAKLHLNSTKIGFKQPGLYETIKLKNLIPQLSFKAQLFGDPSYEAFFKLFMDH